MSNPWDHLPNAKYIDAILVSVKAHPKEWGSNRTRVSNTWYAAWCNARKLAGDESLMNSLWLAIRISANVGAQDAALNAITALVAYNDCAYMLDSDPGELELLEHLGDPRALLLLHACKALAAIKEKEHG